MNYISCMAARLSFVDGVGKAVLMLRVCSQPNPFCLDLGITRCAMKLPVCVNYDPVGRAFALHFLMLL